MRPRRTFFLNQNAQADMLAFMKGRFNPGARAPTSRAPPGRGPAGRFTGAPQGGGGFRAAGVAPRPPPRNMDDVSCVSCGRKGHMAAEGRQPRATQGQPPCFNCNKPGHLARNCPNKSPAVKTVQHGPAPSTPAAFFLCVTTVDADGLTTARRPRPTTITIHHFTRQLTRTQIHTTTATAK